MNEWKCNNNMAINQYTFESQSDALSHSPFWYNFYRLIISHNQIRWGGTVLASYELSDSNNGSFVKYESQCLYVGSFIYSYWATPFQYQKFKKTAKNSFGNVGNNHAVAMRQKCFLFMIQLN